MWPRSSLLPTVLLLPTPLAAQCPLGELSSTDAGAGHELGRAVDVSAGRVLAGAPGGGDLAEAGAAYVYERTPLGWLQVARLTAESAGAGDRLGSAVALSDERALVGAPLASSGASADGAALVFERDGGVWVERARLESGLASFQDLFGSSVDLDGAAAVVGAPGEDLFGSFPDAGSAFVFEDSPGGWAQTAHLFPSGVGANDAFGSAVAISGDRILVGAPFHSAGAIATGAAWIFERAAPGSPSWVQRAKLVAPVPTAFGHFGSAVDLSGAIAVVGASDEGLAGHAYVFEEVDGLWTLTAAFGGAAPLDAFGTSVAVDGDRIAVGAPGRDGGAVNAGAAHLFERDGSGWVPVSELSPTQPSFLGRFGEDVGLAGDTAAAGEWRDGGAGVQSGAVHPAAVGGVGCPYLIGAPSFVSLATGGPHVLGLVAGVERAGSLYFVLGSASGTEPGLVIDGQLLPLVPDDYAISTLTQANGPFLFQSLGLLDGAGSAAAGVLVPPGLPVALAGTVLHHAFLVVGPAGGVAATSGAVPFALVP